MAGFGIFMAILTYGVLGLVLAGVLSLCLRSYAKRKIKEEGSNDRKAVVAVSAVPFVGLLWIIVTLLIHVVISNVFARQDCGFSPDPYVTLPNGYELGSRNTYDGYIKAPDAEIGVPVAGPGYVRSIIDLRLIDGYFIGTQFDFQAPESPVRSFKFDTRTRQFQSAKVRDVADTGVRVSDEDALKHWDMVATSESDHSNSYWVLYTQYRHQWPNYILVALILAGESCIGLWVWKRWNNRVKEPV